ncbi:thiazole tautomerase TenI [Pseudalkalibacillus sp. A8]|uniref:thiazole tautomerase TenI n=1 Tax=Pseudalkalibacillus sp. A8 TaxID=3382641 RepID=UPI0038B5558B
MKHELHVISTGSQFAPRFSEIVSAIHDHVDFIHIREKTWTAREHIMAIELMLEGGVPLKKIIINDRVDVAIVSEAGGVQLANHSLEVSVVRESFPLLKIGRSVHSVEEALKAENEGADYLIYGHIFETASKPGLEPRGLKQLGVLAQRMSIPVIAIGGIKPGNTPDVLKAGASGTAVMSGILNAENPLKAVRAYKEKMRVEEEKNASSL